MEHDKKVRKVLRAVKTYEEKYGECFKIIALDFQENFKTCEEILEKFILEEMPEFTFDKDFILDDMDILESMKYEDLVKCCVADIIDQEILESNIDDISDQVEELGK